MASGEFMRVVPEAQPLKVYGFKKVSSKQLEDIIERLQRPTHCTETQTSLGEIWNIGHIAPRAPFTACRRAANLDIKNRPMGNQMPIKGKVLEKVIRRLQRPTISTMAAEGSIAPSYELPSMKFKRPKTADEQEKLLERIQRPTTASRRKLYGHNLCLLCEDLQASSVHETMRFIKENECDRHGRRSATSVNAEQNNKIQRARSATHASGGGNVPCTKQVSILSNSNSRSRSGTMDNSNLPLLSGLARSDKVSDITNRLHPSGPPPTQRPQSRAQSIPQPRSETPAKKSGRVPPATQVVVFA